MNNKEIAALLGCSAHTVQYRRKKGWSEEQIINTPINQPYKFPEELIKFICVEDTLLEFGYEVPNSPKAKFYVSCDTCFKKRTSNVQTFHRVIKKSGRYRCSSCFAKSDEGKKQRSEQSKKAWSNNEYRDKVSAINKSVANSEEGKKQRSEQSKKAWGNKEYREYQEERTSTLFKSEEHRKLVSDRNKAQYESDPDSYIRQKVSVLHTETARENHRAALQDEEYKEVHRKLAIERFKNPEYAAKIAAGLENFSRGGRKSVPEIHLEDILKSCNIEYLYNKAVGPYNFDFYIPEKDIYFEVQGEYWHSLPNNELRDKKKYSYLKNNFPNSTLVYIWDYDFLTGNAEFKIKNAIFGHQKNVDFSFNDVDFSEITNGEARKFLQTWHYAQFGKFGKFIMGAKLNGVLIGVCKIGPISRQGIGSSIGLEDSETFELDRFCIHPFFQKKNFGSKLLSKSTNTFFSKFIQVKNIISFSDTTHGHTGSLYLAANWKEVGRVKPDYVYVDPNGWVMHKKTLYNKARDAHMVERDYAEKHSYEKVFGNEKIKYLLSR